MYLTKEYIRCCLQVFVQSRPSITRPVIRRIGCNAVDRASRFSAARGEYVEIMVNNVTVILVVRDTCKINSTSTSTYCTRTEYCPKSTIARAYFGCGIVSTVNRLNNTTRVCATKNVRLVDHQHNALCTLPT